MRFRAARAVMTATVGLGLWVVPAARAAAQLLPPPGPLQVGALIRELGNRQTEAKQAPARFRPEFHVQADGYTIGVFGLGESVAVVVERGKAATGYIVRGTVTRSRLQASFGSLGEVTMRFRPSQGGDRSRTCRHHHLLVRHGTYQGKFRFRGEGGFVAVDTQRAKGGIAEIVRRCGKPGPRQQLPLPSSKRSPHGGHPAEPAFLTAYWRHGISATEFAALQERGGRNDYLFETETSRGRMAIIGVAIAFGAQGVFTHDDALTTARVAPPPPFHGAGTYRAAPDGTKTWQGKLSVSLPGTARLPLTGPPFEIEFGTFPISLFQARRERAPSRTWRPQG